MLDFSTLRLPSVFEWIMNAPSLIGKLSRVFQTAQTKNWTTTVAALVVLFAHVARMFGFPLDDSTLQAIQNAAIAVIGFFTGVQVINPNKPDAEWRLMETIALGRFSPTEFSPTKFSPTEFSPTDSSSALPREGQAR